MSLPFSQLEIDRRAPIDVVYLTGASYCGSTLMSFVMNAHPEVLSLGEIGPTAATERPDYPCSCGAELRHCPFALAVKDVIERHYRIKFDTAHWNLRHRYSARPWLDRLVLGRLGSREIEAVRDRLVPFVPAYRARMQFYGQRNAAFMRAALQVSGKRVFFDATKEPPRLHLLAAMSNIRLKVLHLVRDPRGYSDSRRKHQSSTLAEAAREWLKTNQQIDRFTARLSPDVYMRLRYEAFCANPEATLERLTRFIGIRTFQIPDNYREDDHHIIGNVMRLTSDPRQSIKLDEKWRYSLDDQERTEIEQITKPLAKQYGYDL